MEEDRITAEDLIKALEKLENFEKQEVVTEIDTNLITKCVLSRLPEGKDYVFGGKE